MAAATSWPACPPERTTISSRALPASACRPQLRYRSLQADQRRLWARRRRSDLAGVCEACEGLYPAIDGLDRPLRGRGIRSGVAGDHAERRELPCPEAA